MDRLISLEPSNLVAIRIENGQKCYGELTLRNVMCTMPVAFRLQPMNKIRYTIHPQSGIVSPLATLTIEIIYESPTNSILPQSFPYCEDSFLLHSVVVPGATVKNSMSTSDTVPSDWFTTRKKQVFIDSGIKIMFVGSLVLAKLVANGATDEIREVLEKSDPTWKAAESVDVHGQTLLHLAIAQSRADLVQLLLEFEPNLEDCGSGLTPLEAAAASGEALIVELLLARRASVERSESSPWGPIHLASGGGHIEVLKLLLLKNADVDALTKDGNTALHIAVEERRRDCARLLLGSGARTDIRNIGDGNTPLHMAAALGDEHMVKLLLQKGANKDIRNDDLGKTAYDVAAEHGHTRLFDALRLGESLSIAARKGEVRAIQKLLEKGASINGQDQHGWTALHRASFKGRLDAVHMLIEKGADINGRDVDGYTALHCAAESGHVEVIELLIKKGADDEATTSKGVSALQIAESLNYSGITRILCHGGATKDGSMSHVSVFPSSNSFRKGKAGREMDSGVIKKKAISGRSVRNSFDLSTPLAVM